MDGNWRQVGSNPSEWTQRLTWRWSARWRSSRKRREEVWSRNKHQQKVGMEPPASSRWTWVEPWGNESSNPPYVSCRCCCRRRLTLLHHPVQHVGCCCCFSSCRRTVGQNITNEQTFCFWIPNFAFWRLQQTWAWTFRVKVYRGDWTTEKWFLPF